MSKIKGKAPASWFYWKDFDIDTRNMTLEMVGAWMRIMTHLHFSKTRGEKIQSLEAWSGVLSSSKKKADNIYIKYRHHIISGLKYIEANGKIEGREYIIINAKDKIKDTIIGTLASILSFSSIYKEGKIK